MATPMVEVQPPDYFTLAVGIGVGLLSLYALYKNYLSPPEIALDPGEYRKFRLSKKTNVSHNTRKFRFELQSASTTLGLPIGKYISLRFFDSNAKDENGKDEEVRRPYTPVTSDDEKGYFELVIKIYDKGRMTQYLDNLSIGDSIECRGPLGKIHYYAPGMFNFKLGAKSIDLPCKHIGMIAGGTGITPMLQVIRQICKDESDNTQVSLIFGNVSIDDILLRQELEEIDRKYDNFHVYMTLDKVLLFFLIW